MAKDESDSSPSYWLGECEALSEQIVDRLDTERHRPGEIANLFRKRKATEPDPALAAALRAVHSKLKEALDILSGSLPD
jgi:hypothetical protein